MTQTLELSRAVVHYRGAPFRALDDVSIRLQAGEVVGLVGESGSGKSTAAKALLGLTPMTSGEVLLDGAPVRPGSRSFTRAIQAVFQDPVGAFNPHRTLLDSVIEPLRVHRIGSKEEQRLMALDELGRVGIRPAIAERRPGEVSGGQCQRVAIARAVILRPRFLICDEAVSALDVSIQAQILRLLSELRVERGIGVLFISHDLNVISALCDRTAVMYAGRIVETGATGDVALAPGHPYAEMLRQAAAALEHDALPPVIDEVSSDDPRSNPGCFYADRCNHVDSLCHDRRPPDAQVAPDHAVACVRPLVSGRVPLQHPNSNSEEHR